MILYYAKPWFWKTQSLSVSACFDNWPRWSLLIGWSKIEFKFIPMCSMYGISTNIFPKITQFCRSIYQHHLSHSGCFNLKTHLNFSHQGPKRSWCVWNVLKVNNSKVPQPTLNAARRADRGCWFSTCKKDALLAVSQEISSWWMGI